MQLDLTKSGAPDGAGTSAPASHREQSQICRTPEQDAVVQAEGRIIVVEAGAGTGKTSTAVQYALEHPNESILYLAYNTSVKNEAAARFPKNVKPMTTHGVAYRKTYDMFGRNARIKVGNVSAFEVSRQMGVPALQAVAALRTIQNFCASTDPQILDIHVPEELKERIHNWPAIVGVARQVWTLMLDPQNFTFKCPHDGYLKVFAMSQPVIRGYDTIFLDESQDTNPVTMDFVLRQRARIILLGDPYQAMYAFRGAVDAMSMAPADTRLHLTQSFRFGKGIALLANTLLDAFKPPRKPLIGAGPRSTRSSVDRTKPFAVIARTNASIFGAAVSFLSDPRPFHFLGGVDGYRFDKVLDAYLLYVGNRGTMRDVYLKSFGSWREMVQLAEDTEDFELRHLIKMVATYGQNIPQLVEDIKAKHADLGPGGTLAFAGITFSTAHKSKGQEWLQVILADDFLDFFDDNGEPKKPETIDQQEVNILYVAITRAREAIEICPKLKTWLLWRSAMPAAPTAPPAATA